jgi:hypothetical protein
LFHHFGTAGRGQVKSLEVKLLPIRRNGHAVKVAEDAANFLSFRNPISWLIHVF